MLLCVVFYAREARAKIASLADVLLACHIIFPSRWGGKTARQDKRPSAREARAKIEHQ